jgi:methylthioribose-1-phosphate isomerase
LAAVPDTPPVAYTVRLGLKGVQYAFDKHVRNGIVVVQITYIVAVRSAEQMFSFFADAPVPLIDGRQHFEAAIRLVCQ